MIRLCINLYAGVKNSKRGKWGNGEKYLSPPDMYKRSPPLLRIYTKVVQSASEDLQSSLLNSVIYDPVLLAEANLFTFGASGCRDSGCFN